jgi:hypothetical protein
LRRELDALRPARVPDGPTHGSRRGELAPADSPEATADDSVVSIA